MADDKKIVLIVDDSPIITDRLMLMLDELENLKQIVHAGSYAAAIDFLSRNNPHIAILDINLPDKTGIELLRYLRKNHQDTIVMMLTNRSGDYYRDLCQALGARFFIDKSTEFEQVVQIISTLR